MYKVLKSSAFRVLFSILIPILNILNKTIKKKKNTVLFFDSKQVFLNNYALYYYMIENKYNQKYKIYFSMPTDLNNLFDYENVFHISGLFKTLLVFLRTETCYIDIGTFRIKPAKNQKIINLWHGTPLKRIGHMSKSKMDDLKPDALNCFSTITVASDLFTDIYKKSFNIESDQITYCNQVRNDLLLNPKANALEVIGVKKSDFKKTVMWLTTYRVSADLRLVHGDINWSDTNIPLLSDTDKLFAFNEVLSEQETVLLIKLHHGSLTSKVKIPTLSNIKFIEETSYISNGIQLYDILAHCDALVTDYSSVYFDYLLLNRPIIFIIDDFEQYEKLNGFVFENAIDYMPGKKVYDLNDLNDSFKNLDQDDFAADRANINKLVNQYNFNTNSEFVLNLGGIKL